MRETPVFLGLTRPPKFFGLPIGYFIGLMLGALIPFVALDEWKFMLLIPVVYPVLWLIADRNPHLFEIMATVYSKTPPTKNRKIHGGDSYGPMLSAPNKATQELLGAEVLKEDPAARHIPYLAGLTDEIIITRQGDLMASAVIGGLDSLTSEEVEVDVQAEAFARQVGQLGEQFGFYVNKITVPQELDLKPVDYDGFSTEVDTRWRSELNRRKLQRRMIILSVFLRPSLTDKLGLGAWLSPQKEEAEYRAELMERIDRLNEAMRILEGMQKDTGFRRLNLKNGEWLGLLGTIQGQPFQKRHALPGQYLSNVVSNSTFTFKDRVVEISDGQNKRYASMLGIHAYCAQSTPDMLDKLDLPHDIVITNSFTPLRNNTTVEKMKLVRRQMKATDDAAVSDALALEESADNVASGRQVYGLHHMSIMIVAGTRDELEKATSEVWQAAQETGATLVRERAEFAVFKGAFSTTFYGQAPGNWSYRPRAVMNSSNNFSEFAAFHKSAGGRPAEMSPWGENITVLPTVSSSAYRFNFHEAGKRTEEPSAGHTLVIGRPGSGKTLGTAFLMAQARRVGARVIVFDKDQGLEMAVRAMNGSYSAIRVGEATGFNPFQTETDERGTAWLTDWLSDILGRHKSLDTTQTVALNNAVRQIVSAAPNLRNFKGLESLVASTDDNGELLERVREWTEQGRYGWIFSKKSDAPIEMGEEIVGIDMSEILDLDTERSAVLAYLFRRIERVIEDREPTMIVIDEAWKMLNDEIFVKRLHDWLVTMRKKNCVVVMLTQTPGHLEQSQVGQIIAETVNTQILFPNNRAKPEDYKILRTNESEAAFLCAGAGGARIALIRSAGDSVFVDYDLSGLGGALTVLGGGRTGEEKAPHGWRQNPQFWKEML
ncbi:VirB3 family type IV secretion system protein [Tropicibacter sp. R15_0]|uniref:VirB4 family type IV secretion/conjugal transfer ATPase n=1 Tax=Tropicibacter sp. R15_0 TaxID=2821101 RepID=UPI001ADA8909|nr:VirB3 family type IV secretion system protein [Tropicibacter sp. R15_0]MBO9468245.1 VirB3 family type IV secretion system protein [Tropicibacter sp. R15_0]